MANLKSSAKDAKRSKVRALRNKVRMSEIKTVSKKVLERIEDGNVEGANEMFVVAQAKIARAAGKGTLKGNTASRKIAKLAKNLAIAAGKRKNA
ncbi:30S ribosomal protein S20 [Candidatus Babeliales bacterium]|nr:30S ribosomal protein S20 [Candidatus Babeliales bacterium]